MTPEQIKEQLSQSFVRLVAGKAGFKVETRSPDHGVDLSVTKAVATTRNGATRYLDTGKILELQLKATTTSGVRIQPGVIAYDLDVKAYNDLVDRADPEYLTPLYLILFILHADENEWLMHEPERSVLSAKAYWFKLPPGTPQSGHAATHVIHIPEAQRVEGDFFDARFAVEFS